MKQQVNPPTLPFLLTILLLTGLEFLHAGMLAFGAGSIMGEIGASPEEYSLATACYVCVAIVTISKQRWLVERMGWRNFVIISLAFFILGAVICVLSKEFHLFLVGRLIMGLGGAAFMTSGRIIVNLIPPSPMRFVGIKYFATGLAIGIALAPGLASFAVSSDNWSMIFVLLIGVAGFTAILALFSLPSDLVAKELRSQTHPVLLMLLISASFALLYVVQRAQYDFHTNLVSLLSIGSVAGFAIYYFFRSIHRHERPLMELSALKHPRYITGVGLFTFCYLVLGANNYVLPILMNKTLGFSWSTIGIVQSIGLLSALISWFIMMKMIPRWPGAKKYFIFGFSALFICGWQLSTITLDVNLWVSILPAIMSYGVFLMFVMATTAMQTFRDVQHKESVLSNAQQLKNMAGQFGMALGVALATLLIQSSATENYVGLLNRFNEGGTSFSETFSNLTQLYSSSLEVENASSAATIYVSEILVQQSMLMACIEYFSFVAVIGVLGAIILFYQRLMK